MGTLWQDLRYGARMLARNPGFTAVAVLTLALGIGANTAIFSVVNAVLLRPLPYPDPDRVVRIEEHHEKFGRANLTGATFLDLREQNQAFSHTTAFRYFPYSLTGEGPPESVVGTRVAEGFFAVLRIGPLYGRAFQREEFHTGADQVVILSHGLWQRRYGSDSGIIGKTIALDSDPYVVLGVMPPRFQFPVQTDLWLPMSRERTLPENRRAHLFTVLGRLKPDRSVEQARTELDTLARRIEEENPNVDPGLSFSAVTLHERMVAPVRPALLVLLGAVSFLLLIACANVANLLLARAISREKELVIRASLGAGRLRLVRQLLTESVLLGLAGGALGLLLALWGVDLILSLSPGDMPRLDEVGIDWVVLGFTVLLSALTGVVFGLSPAVRAARMDLHPVLKQGGRTSAGMGPDRLRSALVASEVAIALVLLIGAGLLARSFVGLLQVDPGYNANNVLTMFISLPDQKYPASRQQVEFYRQVLDRVQRLPGVVSAAVTNGLPTRRFPSTIFEIEGRPNVRGEWEPSADILAVSGAAFRTLEIPLLKGQGFTESDTVDAPVVLLVNETLARRYWPNQDPLGRRVTMLDWGDPLPGRVVGVVGDVKMEGLDEPVAPAIYYSYTQFVDRVLGLYLLVRTTSDPLALAAAVREQVWAVDKDQPVSNIETMEQVVAGSVAQPRFIMMLLGTFAAVALLLSAVGIYGVISYSVSQRTHEIGIRMALGAQRRDIFRLVVGQGMKLTLIGVAVGLAGSFALTRFLQSLLFGVSATDPVTFAGVAALLAAVALLACYIPARRATKVDPMVALRHE